MKTQLSKPARSRASYTEEYKQQALELWHAGGRNAAKVAAELGIAPEARALSPEPECRGYRERGPYRPLSAFMSLRRVRQTAAKGITIWIERRAATA